MKRPGGGRVCAAVLTAWMAGAPCGVFAETAAPVAEVHRDEHLSVRAGVADIDRRTLQFGEVLSLVVHVAFDGDEVELVDELDAGWFTAAWPAEHGPHLLERRLEPPPRSADNRADRRAVYRFQLLSCPRGAAACPGTRTYRLPDFTLRYRLAGESGEAAERVVRFRPEPETLMVGSAIPLGAEDRLYPFAVYFPDGGYPRPLAGGDRGRLSLGLVAGGLVVLLAGMFMSPLEFFRRRVVAKKPASRWERVLEQLQRGEFADEERFLDAFRRCLVWYCLDELSVDPFDWLKRPEETLGQDREEDVGELAEHRQLFLDVLHQPHGAREALLERLHRLVADTR